MKHRMQHADLILSGVLVSNEEEKWRNSQALDKAAVVKQGICP